MVDLTLEQSKSRFSQPPVFFHPKFFEGCSLDLERAESLHLEEMDRASRKLLLAHDAAASMRLIGMASVYANTETTLELELHRVKSALSDTETKVKKDECDLEGSSKENEALAKYEEQLRTCLS